jgi:hypothetical protein
MRYVTLFPCVEGFHRFVDLAIWFVFRCISRKRPGAGASRRFSSCTSLMRNIHQQTCGLDISSAHLPFRCQRRFAHRAAAQLTLPSVCEYTPALACAADGPLGRGRALTPHRMLARRRRCPADNYLTCMTPSHVPRCVRWLWMYILLCSSQIRPLLVISRFEEPSRQGATHGVLTGD